MYMNCSVAKPNYKSVFGRLPLCPEQIFLVYCCAYFAFLISICGKCRIRSVELPKWLRSSTSGVLPEPHTTDIDLEALYVSDDVVDEREASAKDVELEDVNRSADDIDDDPDYCFEPGLRNV